MKESSYPPLIKRYQAYFIDVFFLILVSVVFSALTSNLELGFVTSRIILLIFFLLYEPLLTSFSATIGQRIMGVRVRRFDNSDKPVNLLKAFLRLFVKILLGWVSFLTMQSDPQSRAIHDMASGSVVILHK